MGFGTEPHADYGIWKELEEGLVEVTLEGTGRMKSFDGYTPGHVIVLRHHPRNYPATYVTDSKDITFRDVTIYHCAGMGITAQFTENILLDREADTGFLWQRMPPILSIAVERLRSGTVSLSASWMMR